MAGGCGGLTLFRLKMYTDSREEDLGSLIKLEGNILELTERLNAECSAMIYTMLCIPIDITQGKGISG
jgi:hypothetical protein